MRGSRFAIVTLALVSPLALGAGCASMPKDMKQLGKIAADVERKVEKQAAVAKAAINDVERKVEKQAAVAKVAINKAGEQIRQGLADLTPEEEHYVGRAVAAYILGKYKTVDDPKLTAYINTLGQTLARSSSRPETFSGYHFMLIKSDEVNAFAAPGGFVFVTTGLYSKLGSEEELAAVLAHEIAHISLKHGLSSLKLAKLGQKLTSDKDDEKKQDKPKKKTKKETGGPENELSKNIRQYSLALQDIMEDAVNQLVQLVTSGYSRTQEYEADNEALRVAYKAGYDPAGLTEFLGTLAQMSGKDDQAGFFKTHPPASERIESASFTAKSEKLTGDRDKARTDRFLRYTKS